MDKMEQQLQDAAAWIIERMGSAPTAQELDKLVDEVDGEMNLGLSGSAANYILQVVRIKTGIETFPNQIAPYLFQIDADKVDEFIAIIGEVMDAPTAD